MRRGRGITRKRKERCYERVCCHRHRRHGHQVRLCDKEGQFLEKASCPTQAGEGGIPEKVIAIVQNMASRHALAGVAIDTAGIVRPGEDGEIVFAGEATFPGYSGTKLGRLVREAVHLPVLVENDVNAAALGERGSVRRAAPHRPS